jgi:hypothetical protein
MGYKTPDDPFESESPPDKDAGESPRSNSTEQSKDHDLLPLPGLGLPDDYDPKFIPTSSELRRVAKDRLDWETAFMILNHDDPDLIVERLDELADMIRAAISVQGPDLRNPERLPSLKKAVRLGLELNLKYWLRAKKYEAWIDLIGPLLTTAIQIKEFQPAVFLHWSIYHYIGGELVRAQKAISASREFAAESGREDLALLAQSYQFNFDAPNMNLDEAEEQAGKLITEAQHLGYGFVRGHVYVALARAYSDQLRDPQKAFEYAQQALTILMCMGLIELASEAVMLMLSIGARNDHSAVYRDQLRSYFECVIEKSVNPIAQASFYFFQGRDQYYYRGQFDKAVLPLLYAWRKYRQAHLLDNVARTLHMLGLVQTKRRKWSAAEFYICEALKRYQAMGKKGYEIHALHAHAFIPYEYEDWTLALARLEIALALALENRGATTLAVIEEIKNDMEDVKKKLQGGNPP